MGGGGREMERLIERQGESERELYSDTQGLSLPSSCLNVLDLDSLPEHVGEKVELDLYSGPLMS